MLNFEYPPLGGGSSPVTRGLARTLVQRGHAVDVVTMSFRDLPREEDDGGVRVFRVPCLRARPELSRVHELASYAASALHRTRALVRQAAYDVCHAHFVIPTAAVAFLLRRSPRFPPYVITSHGSDIPGYNPDRFAFLHRWTPPLLRRIVAAARALITPSTALERLIRQRLPEVGERIVNIPYGIATDRFVDVPKEDLVAVATRLFERKGVQHVVEALAGLGRERFRLEVAGDGPMRPLLESQARALEVPARFHGWLQHDRVDRLLERSRIFVLATAVDNFPTSLLEAMAARCAIVTTRAGGCPEVVGDAALLVDPGDVEGLRSALARLMAEPTLCDELGAAAARRVRELFDWHAVAARHEAVYPRAAEGI
ncbi:MAG: glycosyltransferase family 4 protein [Gemmatimonadota bacterium]